MAKRRLSMREKLGTDFNVSDTVRGFHVHKLPNGRWAAEVLGAPPVFFDARADALEFAVTATRPRS